MFQILLVAPLVSMIDRRLKILKTSSRFQFESKILENHIDTEMKLPSKTENSVGLLVSEILTNKQKTYYCI